VDGVKAEKGKEFNKETELALNLQLEECALKQTMRRDDIISILRLMVKLLLMLILYNLKL